MAFLQELSYIKSHPLELPREVPDLPETGGLVLFAGIVRNINEGKKVRYLEYEAFPEMADKMIRAILEEAGKKWDLRYLDCQHRLGKLQISEIAVTVVTGSMHREEAYAANRYIIDRVKHEVPIWKREFFEDGTSEWSQGCRHGHQH
ncbi:molybdopterin converting factor, subunit 2 [Leptospira inadai serovar Lyme str. 10]|uniref:Molybdopterin synthase catalytic subunit n=2 Tax=Leptospira inadai serovar Lyme TaxID=293084 RepID=V6HVC8_9LEPT|nr:molybdenum cofactor biosynthesis protein MoaE [Leptospira inadai]EQA36794.1 molybdopterin converting factor, subunit 2 [Leptospira inadai serovar Lyme str. 10]PNV75708.1 molybdopterin converting factor [Leptospira inadai serovar Lyme]